MKAAIVGVSGPVLTTEEAALLARVPPAGVILFGRNVVDPEQLVRLTHALRAALPVGAVLLVDQEGGRVARLRPPHWRAHPPAAALGVVFDHDARAGERAAWITGALIGRQCRLMGFDVVCAPVLDLQVPGTHAVIGDRALSADPEAVAVLGGAIADGLMAAGVQPMAKHLPGHGRVLVDSHLELPHVDGRPQAADLLPFTRLADLPWAITAHILYGYWDKTLPATLSPGIIHRIIRSRIGFRGLLVSDDLAMRALSGAPADLALQALAAGCDIAMYCPGDAEGTRAVLEACPDLTAHAVAGMHEAATLAAGRTQVLDEPALAAERDAILADPDAGGLRPALRPTPPPTHR